MKWIAALAVTGFAMLAGRALGGRALRAAEALRRLMDELQALRVFTLERLMPLSAALRETKDPALRRMGEIMCADGALLPDRAWEEAAREQRAEGGSLEEVDREAIGEMTAFFAALGALSRREHEERYAQTIAHLGRMEEEKRSEGREKRRLMTSLGALAGLSVSVMLV